MLQQLVERNRARLYFRSTTFSIYHGMIHCSTFVEQDLLPGLTVTTTDKLVALEFRIEFLFKEGGNAGVLRENLLNLHMT